MNTTYSSYIISDSGVGMTFCEKNLKMWTSVYREDLSKKPELGLSLDSSQARAWRFPHLLIGSRDPHLLSQLSNFHSRHKFLTLTLIGSINDRPFLLTNPLTLFTRLTNFMVFNCKQPNFGEWHLYNDFLVTKK